MNLKNLKEKFKNFLNYFKLQGKNVENTREISPKFNGKPRKKIALIVGHSEERGGAINYLGETEWSFNNRIGLNVIQFINGYPGRITNSHGIRVG